MKRFVGTLAFTGLALACILTPVRPVSAQRYAQEKRYNKAQIDEVIKSVENYSDRFKDYVDHKLDQSWANGSNREDKLNEHCRDMENALDQLRDDFNRRDSWWESRENVGRALVSARDTQLLLNRRKFPSAIYTNWRPLKVQLNYLADRYELPRLAQGRYTR